MQELSPAPWRVEDRADEAWFVVRDAGNNVPHVARVYRDSDARLIAAAPDLLAACEQAAQYMPCGEPSLRNGCIEPEGWADVIQQLSDAISKAKGGE